MSKDATSVGQIGLDLVLNKKKFNKQMSGLEGVAKRAGAKIGAAITAGLSVKALTSFTKSCLDLGSDLTEVQNVVDTAFPKMSSMVDSFAKNAASSFGLSETMAKKYAGTFGAMSKSFGFAEKEAYKMSTALTGLAGDIASFYNISQDEAYTKLKSVFTGETETLKDLGVVMTQANLDQYALANGFGKTTSAMTEQEKVALRYQFVMSQLSLAQGDFVKTSGSWANQVRILTLQMESFKAAIGQGLINIFTPVIQWLNVLIGKLVSAANAFKRFTEILTGKKSQPITLTNASDSVGSITSGADNASTALGNTTKKIKALKRELAGFDQINKLGNPSSDSGTSSHSGGTSAGTTISETPTIDTPSSIEKITKKYKSLGIAVDKLKTAFKGFTDVVGSGLKWAYENVLKPFGKWAIKKWVPALIEQLASVFEFLTAVLKALAPVFRILWDVIKPVFKLLGKLHVLQAKYLTKAFRIYANVLRKIVVPITEKLYKGWQNVLKIAKELPGKIKEIPEKIKEWFNSKLEGAEEWFGGIKDALFNVLLNLTEGLPDLSGIATAISDSIGEVKAKVSAWFADKKEEIKEKWDDLTADVKDKIANVQAKLSAIKDAAFDKATEAWNAIQNKAAELTMNAKETVVGTLEELKGKWESIQSRTVELSANVKEKVAGAVVALKDNWDAIKEKTVTLTGQAVNKASSTLEKLKTAWSIVKSKRATLTGKAINKNKSTLSALKSSWAAIKSKTVTLKAKVTATISNIKNWINQKIIDKLNSGLVKTGLWKKGPIPRLAQGGYVKKNTPQLAMIGDNRHQGEVISPEKKLEEMALKAASMAGGGVTPELIAILKEILAVLKALELNVYLDGKLLKKRIVDLINADTKATGVCEIIV